MRHVNKVELIGRVFKDITPAGKGRKLKVVTEENRKNKDTGDWTTEREYHTVVVWNEDAVAEMSDPKSGIRDGATVKVVGKIKTRKWHGQDGVDRYSTEVVVDRFGEFVFLEAAKEWPDRQQAPRPTQPRPTPARQGIDDLDDEPPF